MIIKEKTGENIDTSRRSFSRLGAAAPVLMTLASRPIFGANCMSNALSGNLSDPDRGGCSFGWSPGGWGQPGGAAPNWDWICWEYGTFDENITYDNGNGNSQKNCKNNGSTQKAECYAGGTLLSQTPLSFLGNGPDLTLREILITEQGSLRWKAVCALLNASINDPACPGSIPGPAGFQYILTVDQLVTLLITGNYPPGFTSVEDFLSWTWEGGAEGMP